MALDAHADLQEKKVDGWRRWCRGRDSARRVGTVGRVNGRERNVFVAGYNSKLVAVVYRECARYHIDPVLVFH